MCRSTAKVIQEYGAAMRDEQSRSWQEYLSAIGVCHSVEHHTDGVDSLPIVIKKTASVGYTYSHLFQIQRDSWLIAEARRFRVEVRDPALKLAGPFKELRAS